MIAVVLLPVNPAIAQALSANPWISLTFESPKYSVNKAGSVLKPPP